MKIGFVLDDGLDRGDGVQQYILTLGNWLSGQGHAVHYLVGQTSRADLENVHSLSRNIKVRFNGNRMSMPLPAKKAPIKQLLAKEKFDVLHVQMPYSPFMAAKVIRAADCPVVGTFHILPYGTMQTWGAKLLSWWTHGTTKRLKQVWSVSAPAQTFAQQLGITSTVLPNVIDLKKFKMSTPKRKGLTVVFLGRLVERKGCMELLQAFELATKDLPEARLVIGGTGPQAEKLQTWVNFRGIENIVSFKGFINEEDKAAFLATGDIAIFPSLGGESFGIVLLEAMAAGAGVTLGGNNPGYSSVLSDIPQSLFDPRDKVGLARLITQLAGDEGLRQKLHHQQQSLVKDYDVAVIGKKLLSYYKDL